MGETIAEYNYGGVVVKGPETGELYILDPNSCYVTSIKEILAKCLPGCHITITARVSQNL